MREYNNNGELICNHRFDDGVCIDCCCPETKADTDKALSNLDGSFTTNITLGSYSSIEKAARAIQHEGLGSGGTIYNKGIAVAQLGPDGLV